MVILAKVRRVNRWGQQMAGSGMLGKYPVTPVSLGRYILGEGRVIMRDLLRRSLVLSLLVLLALSSAGKSSSSSPSAARVAPDSLPREPIGVFAKADLESVMAKDKAIKKCASTFGCDIHVMFRDFYARLLDNPGISGLTVAQHWDQIQTAPDVYDFSFLDDAFNVANDKQKPVALIITPGVVSPKWLLNELPECIKTGCFFTINAASRPLRASRKNNAMTITMISLCPGTIGIKKRGQISSGN
jgi:hypothetical protein